MSRKRKLMYVAMVVAIGTALAWPFRLRNDEQPAEKPDTITQSSPKHTAPPNFIVERTTQPLEARMASSSQPSTSFDLANHPVMAGQLSSEGKSATKARPVTPTPEYQFDFSSSEQIERDSRPAYQTIESSADSESVWPREVVHTVQDGDTLELLAKRYLGDESRAIEIFDMNRTKLTNPHQLPINIELRVPVAPGRLLD